MSHIAVGQVLDRFRAQPLLARPRRVVVAEDDQELRRMLVEAFREAGFEVMACTDGYELAATLHAVFDNEDDTVLAVITDDRMPGFDGLDVLEGVREAGRDLPFVLITAFGERETHQRGARLGAVVLDKPLDIDDLVALVAGSNDPLN